MKDDININVISNHNNYKHILKVIYKKIPLSVSENILPTIVKDYKVSPIKCNLIYANN